MLTKKKRTDFFGDEYTTVCTYEHDEKVGTGEANLKVGDTSSKLMGETVAYYKAIRNFAKWELEDAKKELKKMQDLKTYLFPPKFYGRQVDWIKERLDKKISQLQENVEMWKGEIEDITNTLLSYLKEREEAKEKIKKFKERKAAQNAKENEN